MASLFMPTAAEKSDTANCYFMTLLCFYNFPMPCVLHAPVRKGFGDRLWQNTTVPHAWQPEVGWIQGLAAHLLSTAAIP